MTDRPLFAPDWTQQEREDYVREYLAEQDVEQPRAEHWQDECEHCELVWALQREAEADGA
jgi:hypothetical protein